MISAIEAGVTFFQYRSKSLSRREIYETSFQLAGLARQAGALFIVNDHADIAVAAGADGVHLGQDDLPIEEARKLLGRDKIIGISTHSITQAEAAQKDGAEYIGFGPIFQTATKDAGSMQGAAGITGIKQTVTIPILAIGGINHDNAGEVIRAGADGIAVISAIISAPDFQQAAAGMMLIIGKDRSE